MEIAHNNTYIHQKDSLNTVTTVKKDISSDQFGVIFDMYYKRVYKYICFRINNQHMAEDLCSQAFEKVITRYATFSPEKSTFEVWLFAIVRNIVADYHRKNKKGFHLSLDSILDLVSPCPSPEDGIITEEGNKKLFLALRKLSEKERNIISMKFAAGLKNSEIAELMGISHSNVGVVLYRSLKKLQKLLYTGGYENEK